MDSSSTHKKHKIFVDAHVHIHDCFHLPSFLDAAVANFQKASQKTRGSGEKSYYLLLLSESAGKNYYQKLSDFADKGQIFSGQHGLDWNFQTVSEHGALRARRSDGNSVYLMAGRQIVTAEKLEVLALMTTALFEENRSLIQTVQEVRDSGGIPVLPWGFGKWLGKRGKIVKKFIMENDGLVFLGDNSGRPRFWPRPKLFSVIESKGGKVLPGSDPLPFVSEQGRAGRFGFTMLAKLSTNLMRDLKNCLDDPTIKITEYGNSDNILRCFRNQLCIRARGC